MEYRWAPGEKPGNSGIFYRGTEEYNRALGERRALAVRAGIQRSQFNEHSEALYLTSSFVFENAAQAEEPLGNVALLKWPKVALKVGEARTVTVAPDGRVM